MADLHQFAITPHFDFEQTLREAQHRWLTPVEICEIFRNHHFLPKTDPPNRPPSGSLLLFDCYGAWDSVNDCYSWRQEDWKENKREFLARINAESNDVGYDYTHLAENENFQRRTYWMMEKPLLVLHYLEIKMERSSVIQEYIDLDDSDEVETTTQAGNAQAMEAGTQTSVPKKRRFFSKIWEHYDILPSETQPDKKQRANCKKCPHTFLSASTNGTGNMRRHLNTCSGQTRDVGQMLLSQNESHNSSLRKTKFNYEVFREMLSHVILRHELPFRFVEYEGIRNLLNYVAFANQEIKAISGNTLKYDTLKMYHKEKNSLKKMLRDIPGRISLTCDLWSSVTRDDYISLTAHFVNQDWKLEKKLLNFSYMPSPHNSRSICEKVHALLIDWDIDCKLTSITLDNASFHDSFVGFLKDRLNLEDALLSKGDHFHIRCCARIVNLIVQDCLKEIDSAVEKIRESVRYYRGSQGRRQAFKEAVKKVALPSQKELQQDVPTRWNSIFLMLDSAVFYQKAFEELQKSDDSYECCPSGEEWVKVKEICECLVLFYDVTCTFSGTKYPTSYLYYPQVFIIKHALTGAISGFDPFIVKMAEKMQLKFEKYWLSSKENLVLVFAVVLDPRYKLQFVEVCHEAIYGYNSPQIVEVRAKLWNLFNTYVKTYSKATENSETWKKPTNEREAPSTSKWRMHVFEVFDMLDGGESMYSPTKSQLQLYLDEPRMRRSENVDILAFWQAHQCRYPELSLMARDLLSIPVSTVSSKSSFNVGERVIDVFRNSLEPANAEALICTRDWMFERRGEVMSENLEANLEDTVDDMVLLAIDR